MKIAFVFLAESYQAYHVAAVALALRERTGITVEFFHNDPDTPRHLDRIAHAYGAESITSTPLKRGLRARAIQAPRLLGLAKSRVLADNERLLSEHDAVISSEDVVAGLCSGKHRSQRPARILITHGAGGRAVPSFRNRPNCDLILVKGSGDVERHLREGLARPGHIAAGGYPKLDTSRRLRASGAPLFEGKQPTILYAPHKTPELGSWSTFIEPILASFSCEDLGNLIVAPHVKMFRRRSEKVRETWRRRSSPKIIVDPGSDRLFDNTYTEAADIFVGDVSSQVYEFTARPRPCVFLNPRRIDWRDDPHFRFWRMGEVIEDPVQLSGALARAPRLHDQFREEQVKLTAQALGDTTAQSIKRSADLIVEFMENGCVTA